MDIQQELDHLEVRDAANRLRTPDPAVVAYALEMVEALKRQWPMYVGAPLRLAKTHIQVLYKAALLGASLSKTPAEFVDTQLSGMAKRQKFWLSSLASPSYSEAALSDDDLKLLQLRSYKAQLALFSNRCTLYGPHLAIRDTANDFSPLFRYVLACEYGERDIADHLAESALTEWQASAAAKELFKQPHASLQPRAHIDSPGADAQEPGAAGGGSDSR